MKTTLKINLFISLFLYNGIIFSGCNVDSSQSKKASVDTTQEQEHDNCKNGILSATISPSDLQAIKNMPGLKKIYIQFKTDDDKNYYPAAYSKQYPFTDVSSSFHKNILQPPFYPTKPYILGNVEWKLISFPIDMTAQMYAIFPGMDDSDNIHVTYNYLIIPYTFSYKDSTYTLDSTFFSNISNKSQRTQLLQYVASTATKAINPVPPKQP